MEDKIIEPRERLEFIWLELTARCNLECVHCYADSGPERMLSEGMEIADWMKALDEAAALGCRKVQFIGGEPTLYPGLAQLIAHARRIGYEYVCVYTNGTHFTEALKAAFTAHRVSLAFSVYGSSGEVHDQVTRRNGSFEKTNRALQWAVEARLPVRTGIVRMGANAHDVARAERKLRQAGVREVNIDRLRGLGRGAQGRQPRSQLRELCGRCGSGKVCVSVSGEIFPCVFARFSSLGRFKEGGLGAAFGGVRLHEFREALIDAHSATQVPRPGMVDDASPSGLHASTCSPERPVPPCNPETPAPPCNPETPPPDCNPEKPHVCSPEVTAHPAGTRPLHLNR